MDKTIDNITIETKMSDFGSYYRIFLGENGTTVIFVNEFHGIENPILRTWPCGIHNIYNIFKAIEEFEDETPELAERMIRNGL
ncbi:MAG: hypothetical protein J6Q94_00170 [Clostridia bacterium]|nr:hypothetical protein [Clostridia bacterium]